MERDCFDTGCRNHMQRHIELWQEYGITGESTRAHTIACTEMNARARTHICAPRADVLAFSAPGPEKRLQRPYTRPGPTNPHSMPTSAASLFQASLGLGRLGNDDIGEGSGGAFGNARGLYEDDSSRNVGVARRGHHHRGMRNNHSQDRPRLLIRSQMHPPDENWGTGLAQNGATANHDGGS